MTYFLGKHRPRLISYHLSSAWTLVSNIAKRTFLYAPSLPYRILTPHDWILGVCVPSIFLSARGVGWSALQYIPLHVLLMNDDDGGGVCGSVPSLLAQLIRPHPHFPSPHIPGPFYPLFPHSAKHKPPHTYHSFVLLSFPRAKMVLCFIGLHVSPNFWAMSCSRSLPFFPLVICMVSGGPGPGPR